MYSITMDQPELFEESAQGQLKNTTDLYLPDITGPGGSVLPPFLARLFELSVDAFYAVMHARMSEFPLKSEISRYIEKVCKAGSGIANGKTVEARAAAARAAGDRGDPDVLAVQRAAYKVQHEIHRMEGLLRFSPGPDGIYTARCEPDHFILPAMAEHFTLRFGDTPWAIIDEKRGLRLFRQAGGEVQLMPASPSAALLPEGNSGPDGTCRKSTAATKGDPWEELWRLYHRSINNESRKNPGLQRQFLPERYQKYLVEFE